MQPSPPEPEDYGDDELGEIDTRAEILEVVDHLSPPEKFAALLDATALLFAGAGIEPESEAFLGYLDMYIDLLPRRIRATRRELIEGGLVLPEHKNPS